MYVGPVRFAVSAPARGDSWDRLTVGRSGILAFRPRPAVAAANIRATRSPSLIFFLPPVDVLGAATPNSRSSRSFRFSSRVRTGALVPAVVLDETGFERGAEGVLGLPLDADLLGWKRHEHVEAVTLCWTDLCCDRRFPLRALSLLRFSRQRGLAGLFRIILFFPTCGRTELLRSLFFCLFALREGKAVSDGVTDRGMT